MKLKLLETAISVPQLMVCLGIFLEVVLAFRNALLMKKEERFLIFKNHISAVLPEALRKSA